MNRKQAENTFEIRQTTSMPTVASSGPLNPFSPGRPESREEKWIQSEWRKRMAIEQAIVIETQYAHLATAFLHMHGLSVFDETSKQIFAVMESTRPEALQPYLEKYCKRTLEELATRQFALNDVAVANIAYTVHRDHYPPELKEETKGWLSRLFNT
jgi:hypothetical protein